VYTDVSDINKQPRLGAGVVHVPTRTTLYIDAGGIEETRTIMRAELVAIHIALDKFATYEWVGIFTYSLSSLQVIRRRYSQQGPTRPRDYHHHMILLSGITDLLEERRRRGFRTTLHMIRAHTNIRGNYLADAAAKMAVTQYDSLLESKKLKVVIGEIPPHPPHWVIYTVNPQPTTIRLGVDTRTANLRQSRWADPERERLQMHAFTRPSQQLLHKARQALLRSLHYT